MRSTSSVVAVVLVLVLVLVLGACGDDDAAADTDGVAEFTFREQVVELDDAVRTWSDTDTIEAAHAAAEAAANLVVGEGGPGYGDRDGDGTVNGASPFGLLPGLDGTPSGLAEPLADNDCVAADVLGGTWHDPADRWATMLDAIDAWRPDGNTMPGLPSHPMRVVGWATFTLASDSLDEAREFAGHAQLHVDVTLDALDC